MKNKMLRYMIFIITVLLFSAVSYAVAPTVELLTPANNSVVNSTSLKFTCNATATVGDRLGNISLYHNFGGSWGVAFTNTSPNNATSPQNWTIDMTAYTDATGYLWNCYACNITGSSTTCAFASSNYTLEIDDTAPTISAYTPKKDIESKKTVVTVTTDDAQATCKWESTNVAYGSMTNSFTAGGTSATFVPTITRTDQTLYLRCTDDHNNFATSSFEARLYAKTSSILPSLAGAVGSTNIDTIEQTITQENTNQSNAKDFVIIVVIIALFLVVAYVLISNGKKGKR